MSKSNHTEAQMITAERRGQSARQMLAAISGKAGNTDIAISVLI